MARRLNDSGHDAIHVADIGLLSAPDPEIMRAAVEEDRVQADLLAANLARVVEELERGAIVSLARRHLRVRELPITRRD